MQKCDKMSLWGDSVKSPYILAEKLYTGQPDSTQFAMHAHDLYEVYCFLSGSAKYFVEGNTYNLRPGDILLLKKAEIHSLLINSGVAYERIVITFNAEAIAGRVREQLIRFLDERPLGINNRYSASRFPDTCWMHYLEKLCSLQQVGERSVYLTALLMELYEQYQTLSQDEVASGDIMDIVKYINSHLTQELNLDKICSRFYISKSHIKKKFKQIIGTTVWEYITTKRLLLAKDLMQSGESPTNVYAKCGFKDYCTFFRAYKAKFHVSPKNDVLKQTES